MRLGRLVLVGLVAGAVTGFLIALLRPRRTHPAAMAGLELPLEESTAPLTEVPLVPEPTPGGPASHRAGAHD